MELQTIKNRFGIIGNSPALNHALNTAVQVAATDLTVLINGESGVGKEVFSQIIHALRARKHNPFIAVNCGAIPKGSFTGAVDARKGYFETVSGGTIFLDEIGEMPLGTQARLLRVLESGEFIRVGSSKVLKTDVRVIAATNKELLEYTQNNKFREDLYYRLNTVPIRVPALRDRKEDIPLLFRKFTVDFAERYKTAPVTLEEDAKNLLITYPFPGNVRELKNIAEQISVLSTNKKITAKELSPFLPERSFNRLPVLAHPTGAAAAQDFSNEREILYKLFFDMKRDVTELKKMFLEVLQTGGGSVQMPGNFFNEGFVQEHKPLDMHSSVNTPATVQPVLMNNNDVIHDHVEVEESLNIMDKEKELIIKALKKHKSKRRDAALDLGISERTLYRKLKEYDIEDL
jgi:DNA-binding NtrC family response regulator